MSGKKSMKTAPKTTEQKKVNLFSLLENDDTSDKELEERNQNQDIQVVKKLYIQPISMC